MLLTDNISTIRTQKSILSSECQALKGCGMLSAQRISRTDKRPDWSFDSLAILRWWCTDSHSVSFCFLLTFCSSIHDHTDSHCFMKLLKGQLKETQFEWPDSKSQGDMTQKSQRILLENTVAYINGEKPVCWFLFSPPIRSVLFTAPSILITLNSINICTFLCQGDMVMHS